MVLTITCKVNRLYYGFVFKPGAVEGSYRINPEKPNFATLVFGSLCNTWKPSNFDALCWKIMTSFFRNSETAVGWSSFCFFFFQLALWKGAQMNLWSEGVCEVTAVLMCAANSDLRASVFCLHLLPHTHTHTCISQTLDDHCDLNPNSVSGAN